MVSLPVKFHKKRQVGGGEGGKAGRRKEERHPLNYTVILYVVDTDEPFSLNSLLSITTIQKVTAFMDSLTIRNIIRECQT